MIPLSITNICWDTWSETLIDSSVYRISQITASQHGLRCLLNYSGTRKYLNLEIGTCEPQFYINNWASAQDFQQCGMCDQQSLRSACAYAQHSLIRAFASPLNILQLLSYSLSSIWSFYADIEGRTGSSESIRIKMPHCWKSHVAAQLCYLEDTNMYNQYMYQYMLRCF